VIGTQVLVGQYLVGAQIGGVGLQTVRDWVLRFNAHGPDGLLDGKAPGQPSILSQEHRQHLIQMIEDGPIPAVHGVVRWRLVDLMQWLWEEYQITISKQTLIPIGADAHALTQSRKPMDMMVQGRSVSLFQAAQQ